MTTLKVCFRIQLRTNAGVAAGFVARSPLGPSSQVSDLRWSSHPMALPPVSAFSEHPPHATFKS